MKRLPSWPPDLRDFLPEYVAIGMMPVTKSHDPLPAAEQVLVERAVPKRRREFATGRVLARTLLRELGIETEVIGQREDRTPIWPEGVVGSISHCDDLCVAAVGRRSHGIRSIGVDVEPAQPLPRDIWGEVARRSEWIGNEGDSISPGIAMRRLFSAKEAFYKCIFPVLERSLEFHDVEVNFATGYERFDARVVRSVDEGHSATDLIEGRQRTFERWILSGVIWQD